MNSMDEMVGVGSAAGIGSPPSPGLAATMTPSQIAGFKEPGVKPKKKREVVKATLKRFREWTESQT